MIHASILDLIGDTPLVRLNRVPEPGSAEVVAKVEFFNPGGSVKDRIGTTMIADAEARGALRPGGTVVEATSGNTGVGLALVCAVKGYHCVFVMPDKMSTEKIQLLEALGAEVVITPTAVEPDDPRSYYSVSRRLVDETPGAVLANQYFNPVNPQSHYETTGPEIWDQTGGKLDCFVAGMGTGGTITGIARYLKERDPAVRIVGVDPEGSIYRSVFAGGERDTPHPYLVEGIGEDLMPDTLSFEHIDDVVAVDDGTSFRMARRITREEGILAGGSCGSAVVVALAEAKRLGPGKRVVVLLPDHADRYISKFYRDEWMREHGFLEEPARG
jgi:cystathionine beta-synthase